MLRLARAIFTGFAVMSLVAGVATLYFGWRGFARPGALVAGYWGYTPHRAAAGYYDAWFAAVTNEPGRWTASVIRRGCVAGPDREQPAPQRPGVLSSGREHLDYATDVRDEALNDRGKARALFGMRYATLSWDHRGPTAYVVTAPHGTTVAAFAILPALRVAASFARRRRRRGLVAKHVCPACGYDCRATPGRCPECGNLLAA